MSGIRVAIGNGVGMKNSLIAWLAKQTFVLGISPANHLMVRNQIAQVIYPQPRSKVIVEHKMRAWPAT